MFKPLIKEKNREIGKYLGKILNADRHGMELARTAGLYHKNWSWLMYAVEKLHNDYFIDNPKTKTVEDTIKYLLNGGYRTAPNRNVKLPKLPKTVENLHDRVYNEIMFRKREEAKLVDNES